MAPGLEASQGQAPPVVDEDMTQFGEGAIWPAKSGPIVQAAGGVVWRRRPTGLEIVVVHRPQYDDWSIPKGKLDVGENHVQAALREVEEETGLVCQLGPELAGAAYTDRKGRPKTVRYWAMTPTGGDFQPHAEIDQAPWLDLSDAMKLLSYDRDRTVLGTLEGAIPPLR